MIKVENIDVGGFEHAVRAMRNPMNSWQKSDSHFIITGVHGYTEIQPRIGKNDLDLMHRLYKSGTEHRTYARMIQVSMDITAPLYWWKEMDRYTVGKSQVSCSTMHKIHAKEFELDDFSHEHLMDTGMWLLETTIDRLNKWRSVYVLGNQVYEPKNKDIWWQIIQLLPSSYNQRRTVCMSYETVFKIIKERTGHKLTEWEDFVVLLHGLPYVEEIINGSET